jgi:CTP-dependent riboflavin kinase
MKLEEYTKEKLWPILIETVRTLVMYPNHKAYTRDNILQEKPEIAPEELAVRLNLSPGEALVILYELALEKNQQS